MIEMETKLDVIDMIIQTLIEHEKTLANEISRLETLLHYYWPICKIGKKQK